MEFSATTSPGYGLSFASSSTCLTNPSSLGQASVTPSSGTTSAVFTVTPKAAGTCLLIVQDGLGRTSSVTVNIAVTTIIVN